MKQKLEEDDDYDVLRSIEPSHGYDIKVESSSNQQQMSSAAGNYQQSTMQQVKEDDTIRLDTVGDDDFNWKGG